jgi:hypothetical protein
MPSNDVLFDYTGTKFANNFKTIFGKPSELAINLTTPYRARVRKSFDFTGTDRTGTVSLSLGGGRGSGSTLPTSNARITKKTILSKIETYGKYVMDRKTLIAGSDDKGSFQRSDKLAVKGVVDGVNLNLERQCFGSNSLGVVGSLVDADPVFTLTISAATWIQANWVLGDYVNIETGNSDLFEITAIDAANTAVEVTRITGSQVPVATDEIFLQGSEGNEMIGYADCFDSGVTTLFNVTKQAGWQPHTVDASAATISMDLLADAVIDVQQNTGRAPTEIHCSVGQYKNLLASISDPQYYIGVAKSGEYKMSYKGLSLLSPVTNEELPVLINRFIHDKEVYILNNEESEICFAPKFGWFEEGPQRITGTTEYEYPFGGEVAHFFHPAYQAQLYNLAA